VQQQRYSIVDFLLRRKKVHDCVCVAFKEVASEVEGRGFFEDEVADVGDGQV
jgi:hypothetical protein